MENRPKRNINKPRRYQTTSSEEASPTRKTMEIQGNELEDDVAELRGVLENHSPDMHAHSLTYTQSTINNNHTAHTSETTHSLTYTQLSTVNHATQSFCSNNTTSSYSLTYTQPLTVTHPTQAPFMHEKSQSSYAPQNFHNTMRTFTHNPHTVTTQQIDRFNTPQHDTQLQAYSNIWPTSNNLPGPSSSMQAPREFYNARPEIQ